MLSLFCSSSSNFTSSSIAYASASAFSIFLSPNQLGSNLTDYNNNSNINITIIGNKIERRRIVGTAPMLNRSHTHTHTPHKHMHGQTGAHNQTGERTGRITTTTTTRQRPSNTESVVFLSLLVGDAVLVRCRTYRRFESARARSARAQPVGRNCAKASGAICKCAC